MSTTLYSLLTLATGFGGMFAVEWWLDRAYRRGYPNWLAVPVFAGIVLLVSTALLSLMLFSVHVS